MQTRLTAHNMDNLVFTHHLPPQLAGFLLEGTRPLVASASLGDVLLPEKPCNGFTICVWHFLLHRGCEFTIKENNTICVCSCSSPATCITIRKACRH